MYTFDPLRLAKLDAYRADGIEPYPSARPVSHTTADCRAAGAGLDAAQVDALGRVFTIAGRMVAKNEMGKAGFAMLEDRAGRLQVYIRLDDVGEAGFALWKRLDLGDHLHVQGVLMLTRRGDLTLKARTLALASKCIASLPDKWKGLTDVEFRHRHRYVDLLMDDEVRQVFRARSQVISGIRRFFLEREYLEVETPMMQVIPGGATARPFITHHNALDLDLYLRIAPELYLKRLLVGGFERVFELNRNFRNEGIDLRHNPEFTMLEFYQAHATYTDLMDLTEELVTGLARDVLGSTDVPWSQETLSFARPWRRAPMGQLIQDATGLDGTAVEDPQALRARWLQDHPDEKPADMPTTMGRWWVWFFDAYVEPNLRNPTFVTHFPLEVSPLARKSDADPRFVDRFELFIAGQEVANAFTELNDPVDQAERFGAQAALRASGDAEAMYFDSDYIHALTYGMPPAAGEGLGIDRLVMLLTNRQSIREVILFPTLKPRRTGEGEPTAEGAGEPPSQVGGPA